MADRRRYLLVSNEMRGGEPITFEFRSGDSVSIYINRTTAKPVLVDYLDEDSTPFRICCPKQHAGNMFTIIGVEKLED